MRILLISRITLILRPSWGRVSFCRHMRTAPLDYDLRNTPTLFAGRAPVGSGYNTIPLPIARGVGQGSYGLSVAAADGISASVRFSFVFPVDDIANGDLLSRDAIDEGDSPTPRTSAVLPIVRITRHNVNIITAGPPEVPWPTSPAVITEFCRNAASSDMAKRNVEITESHRITARRV